MTHPVTVCKVTKNNIEHQEEVLMIANIFGSISFCVGNAFWSLIYHVAIIKVI